MSSDQFRMSGRSLLLDIASTQKSSEVESSKSESASVVMTTSEVAKNAKGEDHTNEAQESTCDQDTGVTPIDKAFNDHGGPNASSTASNTSLEEEGPLRHCSLDDEKKAAILIFMQLRDLCDSAQAADSLHEFEYQYRKDHKMLDTKHDLPPSLRKPEESSPRGAIGRAVRKLTPRKASFANLFKGKGWNRNEDTKPADMREHIGELHGTADRSDGLGETAFLNAVDSRF
ncbi:hypothetical protein N0V95_003390 [Ascochyta clinopodiicola]|nr:hypothetical protein N0V95_003390 [Ascochyta clinopodiicola]